MIEFGILVLGGLMCIGSGCFFNLIEETINVSAQTHRKCLKSQFSINVCNKDTYHSESSDTLQHIVELYRMLALPGCIVYINCVHLVWDKFPAGLIAQCKGK